jgi:hypothetical protein
VRTCQSEAVIQQVPGRPLKRGAATMPRPSASRHGPSQRTNRRSLETHCGRGWSVNPPLCHAPSGSISKYPFSSLVHLLVSNAKYDPIIILTINSPFPVPIWIHGEFEVMGEAITDSDSTPRRTMTWNSSPEPGTDEHVHHAVSSHHPKGSQHAGFHLSGHASRVSESQAVPWESALRGKAAFRCQSHK